MRGNSVCINIFFNREMKICKKVNTLQMGTFQIFAAYLSLTPAIPPARNGEGRKWC